MPSYLSPGIYMEEVDRGSKPIEAVGTAVAAFIGYTEKASDVKNGETVSLIGKPTLVTNWTQYTQKFGGFVKGAYTPDSVYGYFANGGSICYIVSIKTLGVAAAGDGKLAAVEIPSSADKKKGALTFTAKEAGPSGNNIVVEVKTPAATTDAEGKAIAPTTFNVVVKVGGEVIEQFNELSVKPGEAATFVAQKSKVITVDVLGKGDLMPTDGTYTLAGGEINQKAITLSDYQGSVVDRKGLGGLEPIEDVTMIMVPDLMSAYEAGEIDMKGVQAVQQSIIDYCELVRYCFAILDAPPGLMPQEVKEWRLSVNYDTTRAALYYPWIEVPDNNNGRTKLMPPSGHMAGVYARTDSTRGVHKAPANELVRNCLGLGVNVTKGEHDLLNPIGINVVRSFPGRGIRIWGARTLTSDPAWRYINVRRLFNMVEESIERGTQWVVFEPNDTFLWSRVTRDVSSFLKMVWRSGALFGATPEQAYFVKCDAETNPPEARDLGQLVVEIGIAPVKPAEFVIMRIGQMQPGS